MTDLVTLEDYKIYKKLTKTENDEGLNVIIKSVSNMVKTYCGHSFIDYFTANKVEVFNIAEYQHAILLNEWPVKEVVSVESRNTDGTYTVVDPSEYFVDTSIDTIFKTSGYWPSGFGSIKITYKAGYETTPEDLKIATLDLVTHYFKEEYKERRTIGQASIDNSKSYRQTLSTKWPMHVARILDMYKNV